MKKIKPEEVPPFVREKPVQVNVNQKTSYAPTIIGFVLIGVILASTIVYLHETNASVDVVTLWPLNDDTDKDCHFELKDFTKAQFPCIDKDSLPCNLPTDLRNEKLKIANQSLADQYYICHLPDKVIGGVHLVLTYNNTKEQRPVPMSWIGWINTTN